MKKIINTIYLFMVYAFLYIPIIVLIVNSFNVSKFGQKWKGVTFKWYGELLDNDSLIQAAIHSLTIALISATCAALLGSLMAIALYRYRFKSKNFIKGLLFVVMMSPDITMAISLLAIFTLISIELGFFTLLIAHITFCLPFVVITVLARLSGFDIRMLEAAKDLGAKEWTILSKIIMPLAKTAIMSGWLLSFTLSLDDVIISSFVTGPSYEILPLKIYSMVRVGISPEINALATVMLVFSLLLVVISKWLVREKIR